MRIRIALAAIACTLGVTAAAVPADASINKRQHKQQVRISKGINNGSLTARETNQLQRQQGRIAAYEARNRADGNGLNRRERANLQQMQNRASKNIYRNKHDRQRAR